MPSKKNTKNNRSKKNKNKMRQSAVAAVPAKSLSFIGTLTAMPKRKFVVLTNTMLGYIPTSSLTSGLTGCFIVSNSPYQPFNTGFKPDSATGVITETNGSDTSTSNGYSLLVQMYRYARVVRTRIRVTASPSSVVDQVLLSTFVSPAGLVPPISYTQSRAQHSFKEAFCITGQPVSQSTVNCSIKSWDALGMTQGEWMAVPPVSWTSNPTYPYYHFVQYSMVDGNANSNSIAFRIEFACEVELENPIALVG
jgi:hypothetical protein